MSTSLNDLILEDYKATSPKSVQHPGYLDVRQNVERLVRILRSSSDPYHEVSLITGILVNFTIDSERERGR